MKHHHPRKADLVSLNNRLRGNPGVWIRYPITQKTYAQARQLATRVNAGRSAYFGSGVVAESDRDHVYLKYSTKAEGLAA